MNTHSIIENCKCPLCGFEFTPEEAQRACVQCPFSKNCGIYCCPHCHYQFIQKSKLVNLFYKFQSWRGKHHEHS